MGLQNSLILDLAGGYGRVTPYLMESENHVVLADLSIHSLRLAKENLHGSVDLVRADVLHLPFIENVFDGVWLTQAFEYVPPDFRETFLRDLNTIMKKNSVAFINVAKVPNECSLFSYLRTYFYWKLVKRQPTILGDYFYKINLEHYKGWHYHSVVLTRRIEKTFRKVNFRILESKSYLNGYLT